MAVRAGRDRKLADTDISVLTGTVPGSQKLLPVNGYYMSAGHPLRRLLPSSLP